MKSQTKAGIILQSKLDCWRLGNFLSIALLVCWGWGLGVRESWRGWVVQRPYIIEAMHSYTLPKGCFKGSPMSHVDF